MDDSKIEFNANEQNALALICEMMAKMRHEAQRDDEFDEQAVVDSVGMIVDKFPSINWGDLYDRFHRQGVNR